MLLRERYVSILLAFCISGQPWSRWRKWAKGEGSILSSHGGPLALPLGCQGA